MVRRMAMVAAALLAGAPGYALADMEWGSGQRMVFGANANGCNLRVVAATHRGAASNPIQIVILNVGTTGVRVNADVSLRDTAQTRSGSYSVTLAASQLGTMSAFAPFQGLTYLTIRFTGCTPA